jgi:ABC-2 type transport system permease protein
MKLNLKKKQSGMRRLKNGSYSLTLTGLVIAGAVVLNLIVGELPSQYTKFDLTSNQLSSLTDQSRELIAGLDTDITLYYLAQESNEDETVARLLERYNDLSSHITVVQKDPVLYPKFASQYTDETLSENSVIVTCGDQSQVISYDDMYEYSFNYSYYSYETTGFDAEGQITSAIAALSSGSLPKVYLLTGHGDLTPDSTLTSSISKDNIETEELNLISADAVPEDADALLIASPTQDLSNAETQKVLNYLRRGGQAIILTDYTGTEMPNLDSILSYYGVSRTEGVVMETNSNYYVQLPYYLLPEIESTDVSSDLASAGTYVLLSAAQGLTETDDVRDGVTITDLLSTSDSAYAKNDVEHMTTYSKESTDTDGPFALAVLITEDVELTDELLADTASANSDDLPDTALGALETEDAETEAIEAESTADSETETEDLIAAEADTELTISAEAESETDDSSEAEAETAQTRLAVFTSSALMDSSADQMVSGGNFRLLLNTLSWTCGNETSVSVPVKSLSVDYLTVTSSAASFWSIVTIGVIPGVILLYGLYVWLKRRRQ